LKVPSFPDDIAMALIEEELGQPWQNIYSELSSSPIAAGSSRVKQLDILLS
jgi:aarF domain-containing kinase